LTLSIEILVPTALEAYFESAFANEV
jgi:hypothetical protein